MNKKEHLKELLVNQIQNVLEKRIETAIHDIELAKESRDNETKSSVGDKYETGRAMVQFEIEKNNVQLNKAIQLKNEVAQIDLYKKSNIVEFGSIVKTNRGNYFVSVGLGKIEINNEIYFCVSLVSPIGKILQNKCIGDIIVFQGNEMQITEII